MLVLLYFVWPSLDIFARPVVPPPHFNAKGLVESKGSQWQRRLGLELWRLLPFSPLPLPPPPSCSLSLALMGVCLAVLLLYLY